MDHRRERNEFGLDELNEQDVRNERGDHFIKWAIGGLAVFALFAGLAFFTTTTGTQMASETSASSPSINR